MLRIARTLSAVPVIVLLAACRKNQPVSPDDPPGALLVTNVTTGAAFDLDGYAVVVGERTFDMDANAEILFSGLPDGTYPVELRGLAANCSTNGAATRSISIEGNRTTNLRFDIACSAPAELARIRILFARGSVSVAVQSMNADGSGRTSLGSGGAPDLSPDGRSIAFTRRSANLGSDLLVMSAEGTGVRTLATGTYYAPDWAPDGRSVAVGTGEGWEGGAIVVIPLDGGLTKYVTGPSPVPEDGDPRWSPDGARLLFTRWDALGGGATHVWTVHANGTTSQKLSSGMGGLRGVWSPDGRRIAYRSFAPPGRTIVATMPDGSSPEILLEGTTNFLVSDWSPDGSLLLLTGDRGTGIDSRRDLYLLRLSDRALWRLTADAEPDNDPKFWVAR